MVIIFIYKKIHIFHIISYLTCTMRRHKIFAFMLLAVFSLSYSFEKEKGSISDTWNTKNKKWKFPKEVTPKQQNVNFLYTSKNFFFFNFNYWK